MRDVCQRFCEIREVATSLSLILLESLMPEREVPRAAMSRAVSRMSARASSATKASVCEYCNVIVIDREEGMGVRMRDGRVVDGRHVGGGMSW